MNEQTNKRTTTNIYWIWDIFIKILCKKIIHRFNTHLIVVYVLCLRHNVHNHKKHTTPNQNQNPKISTILEIATSLEL